MSVRPNSLTHPRNSPHRILEQQGSHSTWPHQQAHLIIISFRCASTIPSICWNQKTTKYNGELDRSDPHMLVMRDYMRSLLMLMIHILSVSVCVKLGLLMHAPIPMRPFLGQNYVALFYPAAKTRGKSRTDPQGRVSVQMATWWPCFFKARQRRRFRSMLLPFLGALAAHHENGPDSRNQLVENDAIAISDYLFPTNPGFILGL